MDPNAVWFSLLAAAERGEHEEAGEIARDLLDWLRKGGFPPATCGLAVLTPALHADIAACVCRSILRNRPQPSPEGVSDESETQ